MRSAIIRIKTDLTDLKYDDSDQITIHVELQADNPLLVKLCVIENEGDIFEVTMQFPTDYPFSSPTITITGEGNYPDLRAIGRLMTSFLQNNWTPKYTIKDILQHILDLLHYPDIVLNEFEQVALADAIED